MAVNENITVKTIEHIVTSRISEFIKAQKEIKGEVINELAHSIALDTIKQFSLGNKSSRIYVATPDDTGIKPV